jgi:large subunit ribosomal protein L17
MRHGKSGKKLSRSVSHRRSLMRNMATSLILHESSETTLIKAKSLRPVVEKLITLGRTDSLHNRRQALSYLTDKKAVHKLFAVVGPRFIGRNGGYTRIVRTGYRVGDAAEMAVIAFVDQASGKAADSVEASA